MHYGRPVPAKSNGPADRVDRNGEDHKQRKTPGNPVAMKIHSRISRSYTPFQHADHARKAGSKVSSGSVVRDGDFSSIHDKSLSRERRKSWSAHSTIFGQIPSGAQLCLSAGTSKSKTGWRTYLAAEVKSGRMSLSAAQRGIASDWTQYLDAANRYCTTGGRCEEGSRLPAAARCASHRSW